MQSSKEESVLLGVELMKLVETAFVNLPIRSLISVELCPDKTFAKISEHSFIILLSVI